MIKKKAAKKIEGKKYLLHFTAEVGGEKKDLWEKINTTKGPCYKNAMTLLKRKLHSSEATKDHTVLKVNHLYNILV